MSKFRMFSLVAIVAIAGAACTTTDVKTGATLKVTSPATGSSVGGNVVELAVEAAGVAIVTADGDTSGDTGHFHVFIDKDPVAVGEIIPKEAGIVHAIDNPIVISGLTPGEHRFVVVYGDGTHTRITDAESEVTLTVDGPSVTATSTVDGDSVTVDATVAGVDVVVDPPSAEHLHFFLDEVPDFTAPIPLEVDAIVHTRETSVTFEGVTPGEHTIYVVLADATHTPLDPVVWTKLTVAVA